MPGARLRAHITELGRRVAARIDAAVMPRCCVFCGTECFQEEAHVCAGCTADLPWNACCCRGCGRPVPAPLPAGVDCAPCQRNAPPWATLVAPLLYEFPVDAAIKSFKFRRKLHYAPAFGAMLHAAYDALPDRVDALLPVPLHWRRRALRGFNQAEELCRPLVKREGLPLVRNVVRFRPTAYQSALDARSRRRNLRDAFELRGPLSARHVVIVDDVVTSGATCRALARLLLEGGADAVSVLALARAV